MAGLLAVSLFIFYVKGENHIPIATIKRPDLRTCVSGIINKHNIKEITYVDIHSDADILKDIEDDVSISILSREAHIKLDEYNKNYVIHAGSVSDFIRNFQCLTKEGAWEPTAKFLIIFNQIEENIRAVFDELLRVHVVNALVLDTGNDTNLYTYNPFENYGCGKRYEGIISYGKCLQTNVEDFFPDKLLTGIRNCTFNVESWHWPPYTINPRIHGGSGVEQFILKVLTDFEHFHLNYTYTAKAEYFSTIDDDMTATGPMKSLQNNEADITIGGIVLKRERAAAFDVIWCHIPFVDEIVTLVKKAERIYSWKYLFLEFPIVVWVMLMLSFVFYAFFAVTVLKIKDKSLFVLNMFGALLLHGMKMSSDLVKRFVLMCWVVFAFLVSSHYLCSLTSLTTNPLESFQVSTEEDLETYNLKACVSPVMQHLVNKLNFNRKNLSEGCDSVYQSMETISDKADAYTMTLSMVYYFYKHEFCDELGCRIYKFPQPIQKVMYAIYFYKGFPIVKKLHKHVMHLRESGLITKAMKNIYFSRDIRNKVFRKEIQNFVVLPWHALAYGWIISAIAFVAEIWLGRKVSG